jgi:hypothetical protein
MLGLPWNEYFGFLISVVGLSLRQDRFIDKTEAGSWVACEQRTDLLLVWWEERRKRCWQGLLSGE